MIAEIIAVGSEMLTPYRQDTNSLAITAELNLLGVTVAFKTILGDSLPQLTAAARIALSRADIVILSGGLGPTEDDLTREAVAAALGFNLHRDPELASWLEERFRNRGIQMTENNLRQANVIDDAEILPNANGTAPGQWIDTTFSPTTGGTQHRKIVVLLPGPPKELKPLLIDQCVPRLRAVLPRRAIATRILRMAVVPESAVDARTAPIYKQFTDVETTILSTSGEIQLHFLCAKPSIAEAKARVDEVAELCEHEMEEFIFSSNDESLETVVLLMLGMRHLTLATAESCTGGLVAQRLTSVPGSSRAFLGGVVVYADTMKTTFADVPRDLIAQHGAVSPEVAAALAEGIRQRTGADIGIGITGISGPGGATLNKPVGRVYIALAAADHTDTKEFNLSGDRERIRWFASQHALDQLRRRLM